VVGAEDRNGLWADGGNFHHHAGCGGGFGSLFVDLDVGPVDDGGEEKVFFAGYAGEVCLVAEGVDYPH